MIVKYDDKDITKLFADKDVIEIPAGDVERSRLFGDPCFGKVKVVTVIDDFANKRTYDQDTAVVLRKDANGKFRNAGPSAGERLRRIHASLSFSHGSLADEYPEQLMAVEHILPDSVVLEIGGNVGRNSCVIASILSDSKNLVVFESDPDNAAKLKENRDANGLRFEIVDAAISKKRLVQKDWNTRPEKEEDLTSNEWTPVKTVTWGQVLDEHNLKFDTLVADCEGAMYHILRDEPDFLRDFKTVIIENDFDDPSHKTFVDSEFQRFGFRIVHRRAGGFGPCFHCFYEVWKR